MTETISNYYWPGLCRIWKPDPMDRYNQYYPFQFEKETIPITSIHEYLSTGNYILAEDLAEAFDLLNGNITKAPLYVNHPRLKKIAKLVLNHV